LNIQPNPIAKDRDFIGQQIINGRQRRRTDSRIDQRLTRRQAPITASTP